MTKWVETLDRGVWNQSTKELKESDVVEAGLRLERTPTQQ
jgi:hypothetical protein